MSHRPKGSARRAIAVLTVAACAAASAVAVISPSNASAADPPAFVQQMWTGQASVGTAGLGGALPSNITTGNRLVVLTEMWHFAGPTAATVTDSAGNTYTKLLNFKGPDQAEMSVWTAPITAGGGTKPTITVRPTSTAHLGFAVMEYSGLSTVNNATIVDQMRTASGTTGGAATTVSSGATPALTTNNALVLGFYVDSGFDATVTTDAAYTQRVNNTPNGLSLVVEDRILSSGATPNATARTGPSTVWLMATVALKSATGSTPTAPAAPSNVIATAGDQTANVTWTAPSDGGSPITSYTITPYIGTAAQTPTTVTGTPPVTTSTITGLTNGTAYTFRATATNAIGTSTESPASNSITPTAPTAPAAPTNVTATAGNQNAIVVWTAPSNGGSPITSYTITPYIGATAQTPTTVTGTPPVTTSTITGLTNGTAYTFRVAAANAIGTGPESASSNSVTPQIPPAGPVFVQQTWTGAASVTTAGLGGALPSNVTAGNRLIVLTEMWAFSGPTAATVTDSVGNTYTKLLGFKGPDNTEMSVWSAPITAGGGTKPTITVRPTANTAHLGFAVVEYSGLSTVNNATIVDQSRTASGTTGGAAATIASGATAALTTNNTLVLGLYVDSGFDATVTTDAAYTQRVNNTPQGLSLVVEDRILSSGATPNATVRTGANTVWLMATLALKSAAGSAPTAPAAPTGVTATAGNQTATITWAAPSDGGSPITSYTITPYIGATAQTPTTITGTPPATNTTINGLTNGTAYTFRVTATNAIGTSTASAASNSITPTAPTAPAAPTNVTATAANQTANVAWTAPSNGGSPITSYTVTPFVGATAQTPATITGTPPVTNTTITGLTNGTAYTFKVTASNAIGTSPDSAASNSVTPAVSTAGEWGAPINQSYVAVHSVLLNTGKLLQWDGWLAPQPTSVWDVATNQTTTIIPHASIFCSGNVQMPGGKILVVGGHGAQTTGEIGIKDTTIFDPQTSTWNRVADMRYPRWYAAVTELADGRYVAISGNSVNGSTWADTPEVYDPVSNTWTELTGISTTQVHEEEYPFAYLAPNGKVFTIGTEEDNSFFLDVNARTWTPVGGASTVKNGSSVMYRPGKVLYTGGSATLGPNPARATTAVIDLTAATPAWRTTQSMAYSRVYHTLTMMADGRVLAVGGQPQAGLASDITIGVLPTEIWDPATETWSNAAPIARPRGYHSTALLMPDGRIMVSGGGHSQNHTGPGQASAEFYTPSYLLNGPRPTITSMPSSASYGSNLSITTPDASSIRSINLVSLGADTHQSDMSQHFVPLNFTANAGGVTAQMPSNAADAPPADYMVFIINDQGVPSVAKMISVTPPSTAPAAPTNVNAAAADQSAIVTWTAPATGGSPITGYTVTPYVGTTAQTPTTVTGTPPATNATITGLTNGTAYTFKVTATNAIGTGPESAASNAVTPAIPPVGPAFVQQMWTGQASVGTAGLGGALPSNITTGNRLVVLTEMWHFAGPTAATVTDSAGNTYTKLLNFKGPDQAEMSVWTAPITAGGGTKPTITVRPTSTAHLGFAVMEYSGLSTVNNATIVDQMRTASGTTGGAATTVSSGATPALTTNNALVLGFYVDSGFDATVTTDAAYTQRVNNTPNGLSLVVEDRILSSGATPNATARTGPSTVWLMATVALKSATGSTPTAPAAPAAFRLTAADAIDTSTTSATSDAVAPTAASPPADVASAALVNGDNELFCLIRKSPEVTTHIARPVTRSVAGYR